MKLCVIEIRGKMTPIRTVNDEQKITYKLNGDDLCFVCLIRFVLNSRLYKSRCVYALNYACAKIQQENFKLKASMQL